MVKNSLPTIARETPEEVLSKLIGKTMLTEGKNIEIHKERFIVRDGILRHVDETVTSAQQQTSKAFGFEWHQKDRFDQPEVLNQVRSWLIERYGYIREENWWKEYGEQPIILDAGCGAAISAVELFGEKLHSSAYLGADISSAVDIARLRFREKGFPGAFIQCDLNKLPFPKNSIDIIFSEGVLHHTDSTEQSLKQIVKLLRPGGRILFYVYKKKAPMREFADDYIRQKLNEMSPKEADQALLPLTKLGKVLGDLNLEIEIPEEIPLLEIPQGKMNLQRLFYWYFIKIFYRSDWSIYQMNNCNFDWYAPTNCHRHTPEEIQRWCIQASLNIEKLHTDLSGITVIARKN